MRLVDINLTLLNALSGVFLPLFKDISFIFMDFQLIPSLGSLLLCNLYGSIHVHRNLDVALLGLERVALHIPDPTRHLFEDLVAEVRLLPSG